MVCTSNHSKRSNINKTLNIVESNIRIDKFILVSLIIETRCSFHWQHSHRYLRLELSENRDMRFHCIINIVRLRMWSRLLWRLLIVFQLFAKASCYPYIWHRGFVVNRRLKNRSWTTNNINKISIWTTIQMANDTQQWMSIDKLMTMAEITHEAESCFTNVKHVEKKDKSNKNSPWASIAACVTSFFVIAHED